MHTRFHHIRSGIVWLLFYANYVVFLLSQVEEEATHLKYNHMMCVDSHKQKGNKGIHISVIIGQ